MPIDKNVKYRKSNRSKPLILVTNDDGVNYYGIKALAKSLKKIADILIVAPAVEQSAMSHALTLYRPLRCDKIAKNTYVVDGTPTDCINLAVHVILKGHRPDMIFSGINKGPNLGDDVHYSGTVSAAVEGGILGIPSVAISLGSAVLNSHKLKKSRFNLAARFAVKVAREVLKKGLPKGVILNVNVPSSEKIKGYKYTILGKKNYSDITSENKDPRGRKFYWIHGEESGYDDIEGSDCNAIGAGHISITPIRVDPTAHHFLNNLKRWRI